ncbi:MAG: hypothetical protein KJ749_08870, partial [Planctomycetes bacterium]|nr:hypothetical protein [Planctomycetota bacterium]
PSIMVNRDGNVALGFSGSHAGQYAAAYYTGRSASDPLGEMAPPALLKAGEGPNNHIDEYGRNRWGDYSYTTLDPVDERRFWTIQEYAESGNRWGTWVGVLRANDCNANGIPDSEDISEGTSFDSNGNSVPDECEVEPPNFPEGDYMNRFIRVSPENEGITTGFQVSLTSGPGALGVVGWVGEPFDPGCPGACLGKYFARVVDEPVYRIWTEESVYVGDCEIVPVAQYEVRASGNEEIFSEPETFRTIVQPAPHWWADVVGIKFLGLQWEGPNGVVNFDDVTAAIQYFMSHPTGPVLEWVEIEPQELNFIINFSDIMQIVLAFQGGPYPFVAPADCP